MGFLATANLGMKLALGDVVLLNSDTVVTSGWLQGLQRCLESDHCIATATPWSNNSEITSLPDMCKVNNIPPSIENVASAIVRSGPPVYPEIPTAVGFSMAISRTAIEQLGWFDEERFGLGYGEENEYSRRAARKGFRNVLCDDVYVVHKGGKSFGPRGLKPDEESMQRLLQLHPDYLDIVGEFIRSDPLSDRRSLILQSAKAAGSSFE